MDGAGTMQQAQRISRRLIGVHEPVEDSVFAAVVRHVKDGTTKDFRRNTSGDLQRICAKYAPNVPAPTSWFNHNQRADRQSRIQLGRPGFPEKAKLPRNTALPIRVRSRSWE